MSRASVACNCRSNYNKCSDSCCQVRREKSWDYGRYPERWNGRYAQANNNGSNNNNNYLNNRINDNSYVYNSYIDNRRPDRKYVDVRYSKCC